MTLEARIERAILEASANVLERRAIALATDPLHARTARLLAACAAELRAEMAVVQGAVPALMQAAE